MARYRLLITLAIVSLAFATYGDQPVFAPRDPSAARKDFSNVDPSTAIDALNLGTMATEAKTDYVATGTFTDHEGDTSTHGKTTLAGVEDIPNNASFTLANLGTKPFSALTDTPTTLAGYGITDAYTKTELDATLGSISAALDEIIGAP